jgi:hypothetical protein
MLRSWTRIDFIGSNVNSPTNAIYMTTVEHVAFRNFKIYLDKDAVSRFFVVILLLSLELIFSYCSTQIFTTSTKYVCSEKAKLCPMD